VDGLASWGWVIDVVRETISQGGYAFEFFEQPLAAVYGLDDELDGGWGRSEEELGEPSGLHAKSNSKGRSPGRNHRSSARALAQRQMSTLPLCPDRMYS
jgi:hypothetical protein